MSEVTQIMSQIECVFSGERAAKLLALKDVRATFRLTAIGRHS
jgi:hypothetical protein